MALNLGTRMNKKKHKNTRDTVGLSVVIGASSSGGVEAKWTPLFLVGDRSVGWGVRHMRKQLLASKREQTNNGTGTPKTQEVNRVANRRVGRNGQQWWKPAPLT